MSRKKHGLLKEGLSSELFLLALLKPSNLTELGERLQNTKTPSLSKIYTALGDLEIHKYVKNKDKIYHANPKKLVLEIENILESKNQYLDDAEKKIITLLLSGNSFLGFLSFQIIEKIRGQPKSIHKTNALEIFSNHIGQFSTIALFQRSHDPRIKKASQEMKKLSFDKIKEIIYEFDKFMIENKKNFNSKMSDTILELSSMEKKSIPDLSEIVANIKHSVKTMSPMILFYSMKVSTLKKLSLLWDQKEGFDFGVKIYSKYAH